MIKKAVLIFIIFMFIIKSCVIYPREVLCDTEKSFLRPLSIEESNRLPQRKIAKAMPIPPSRRAQRYVARRFFEKSYIKRSYNLMLRRS